MSNYDTLTNLEATGELKNLVDAGYMPVKICYHLEVYRFVDMRIRTGSKVNEAVTEASVSMKMCRSSIFKIMRGFKQKQ